MKPSPSLRRLLLASALLATASSANAQLYWDTNDTTAGFGTAGGTWGSDAFWNDDATGGAGTFSTVTATTDAINFGTNTSGNGLAAGTISVTGTVNSGNLTFGSQSGLITLSGGTINFASGAIITSANESNTITSDITGSGNLEFRSTKTTTGTDHLTTLGKISNTGNVTFNAFGGLNNARTIFRLDGASDYTGDTSLEVGGVTGNNVTVVLGVNNALSTGTVVSFANTAGAGTGRQMNLNLNGFDQTLAGISTTGTPGLRIRRVHNTSATASTLTINGNTDQTFIGVLGSNGVGGGFNLTQGNNFSVVKDGTGIWHLGIVATSAATNNAAARNSYTGGTTVNAGGVSFLNPNSISGTGTHTFAAGTILGLGVSGGSAFSATDINNAFNNNMTGNLAGVVINATTGIGLDTTLGNATFSGNITGSPASDLVKLGANTLTLSGNNTYTGATHVNSGTLQINSTGAIGSTSALHLGTTTSTTLRVNVNDLTLNAPIHTADAGQTSTILGVFNTGSSSIPVVTTLNAITGAGDLLLSNDAPLPGNMRFNFILNAAGDHTGTTTIASKGDHNTNVILGVANGLSTATVLTFANSGGVGSGRQMNFDLNGFDQQLSGLQSAGANLRAIRVHNTSETAATLTINDDGDRAFRGALGTTGTSDTTTGNNFGIVKNGTGTWNLQLSNLSALVNSYSGGTILNQGGITLGNGATLGSGSLQVNNTNTGAGTNVLLTLASGNDLTVGSLSGTLATPASGTNTAGIATQSGRTFTVNQTADGTFDGVISGAGDFALGADSTHSLTLSAENTYSGATTVSAGTLYITGALANSAVTVGVNGAIGRNDNTPGGGRLGNGLTIEEGGQLDLTGAMLGLNSSGILSLTGGSLTLGALTFQDLHGWDWFNATPGTYQLIDGGFSVDFGDTPHVSEATAYDFGNGKSGYFTSGSLNAVIIPEPGTTVLIAGLGLLALLRRRR